MHRSPPPLLMKKILILLILIVVGVGAYSLITKDAGTPTETSGKQADPRIVAALESLVGTWSSEDDRNVQLEYRGDGTYADSIGTPSGEQNTEGTWYLFTSDSNEDVTFQLNNKDAYISQTNASGKTYMRIASVTPTELELVNMETGVAIRYGKLPTGHEMTDGVED